MYVGRLAPSPTGKLHFGVTRSLLGAWLDARSHQGRLLLRIEDIDRPRVVAGAADEIQRDLEWLGLDWDAGPVLQTERDALYRAALVRLDALGRTFPCTCSRREIALASSAPHASSDESPRYPGTCRAGSKSDRPASVRLRTQPGDLVRHVDRLFGACDQDVDAVVGDFVLRRADGLWAYQLAVVVDDLEQGVTDVVRGADLLSSTARQILLRRLLDPTAPPLRTLHLPLVRGVDGKRLAKRDGAAGIASRREAGEPAERVVGDLAASLGLVPAGTAISARELVTRWEPRAIPTADTVFSGSV